MKMDGKVNCEFTKEQVEDIKKCQGIDAVQELESELIRQLNKEIKREIISNSSTTDIFKPRKHIRNRYSYDGFHPSVQKTIIKCEYCGMDVIIDQEDHYYDYEGQVYCMKCGIKYKSNNADSYLKRPLHFVSIIDDSVGIYKPHKKEIKRVYNELDPYGEEDWES